MNNWFEICLCPENKHPYPIESCLTRITQIIIHEAFFIDINVVSSDVFEPLELMLSEETQVNFISQVIKNNNH